MEYTLTNCPVFQDQLTLLGSANPKIRTKAVAGLAAAAVASAKQADQRAEELVALIDGIRQAGATTLQSIADALNARGIPTARGGQWYPTTVRNAVRRAGHQLSWLPPAIRRFHENSKSVKSRVVTPVTVTFA